MNSQDNGLRLDCQQKIACIFLTINLDFNYDEHKRLWIINTQNIAVNSLIKELWKSIMVTWNELIRILSNQETIKKVYEWKNILDPFNDILIDLDRIAEQLNKKWEIMILWISNYWNYAENKVFYEKIKKIKKKHDNIIVVAWWPDFNLPGNNWIYDFHLNHWVDIINIWWANEFINFLSTFWKDDKFFRDEKWILHLKSSKKIPENLIIWSSVNRSELKSWKHCNLHSYYSEYEKLIRLTTNTSTCMNHCDYCSADSQWNIPLTENDIDIAISNFNELSKTISYKGCWLIIENLNPMQYIDRFERFFKSVDLNKINSLSMYGNFFWLKRKENFDKIIWLINRLNENYPRMYISINFGIDSITDKHDWDFLGRKEWHNILTNKDYEILINAYLDLLSRFKWNPNIDINSNYIFHPDMDMELYQKKIWLIIQIFETYYKPFDKRFNPWFFPLIPYWYSKTSSNYKWFYIEDHNICLTKAIRLKIENMELSNWWYFYKNSSFIDILCLYYNIYVIIWLGNKTDIIIHIHNVFLELDNQINSWQIKKDDILINCLTNLLNLYSNNTLPNNKYWNSYSSVINYIILFIEYIQTREKHICRNNHYYPKEKSEKLCKKIETIKLRFSKIK